MATTVTYVIQYGDTLTSIAKKYSTTVAELVRLNNINNANVIYAGDTIVVSGEKPTAEPNNSNRAIVTAMAIQTGASDKNVYAVWDWDKENTEKYEVRWYYDTGDKTATGSIQWWIGTITTVDVKQSIYNAPENAIQVRVVVRPIAKTENDAALWTAEWSTEKIFTFQSKPDKPSAAPNVTIENYTLTVTLDNININATHIQFEVVRDNDYVMYLVDPLAIKMNYVSYSCTITLGSEYKVRYRGMKDDIYGEWSDYSANKATKPDEPTIEKCSPKSKTSIYLEWTEVKTATGYEIQYAEKMEYFDNTDSVQTVSIPQKTTYYTLSGLETGMQYYFRMRATNNADATVTDGNKSGWSNIVSVTIGKKPAAPTTWSSTVTAIVGEDVTLFWVHNSSDASSQTYAQIELYIDGSSSPITRLVENSTDEDTKDLTSKYVLPTSLYLDGAEIQWRVRTAGVLTDNYGNYEYGEWSITRVINVYAKPTVSLAVKNFNGEALNYKLTSFPFSLTAITGPNTQSPIGYHVSVISLSTYESVDNSGNPVYIKEGDEVYANHFDISDNLEIEFSAHMLDLEPNAWYQISVMASMNTGLTAVATYDFLVNWAEVRYSPNAEIYINKNSLVSRIGPYCVDENGELIQNMTLSVYRKEYDGNFVELATNLPNQYGAYITDPHPALDYARYRIVARDNATGAVGYYDMPGVPVGEKAAVIQWNESWKSTNTVADDLTEEVPWAGSMLKLPYNLDVSNSYKKDVSHVEYIGRTNPVSYYGTHTGETQTWSAEIPTDDHDTLYLLRRLAIWMGDVYIREPSGVGYWATVEVSWPKNHQSVTIPVSINVTRVEGGV